MAPPPPPPPPPAGVAQHLPGLDPPPPAISQAANITGFSQAEVKGHHLVAEFISQEYKESVQRVLERALQGEGTANFEFPLYTRKGRPVEILLNATPRVDSAGNLVGVVGVGQDITDKKEVCAPRGPPALRADPRAALEQKKVRRTPPPPQVSAGVGKPPHGLGVCLWMHLADGTGNSPSPGRPTPGVFKQDKSSGGFVDTTKTRSDPQRVRISGGERPMGAAKGKQSDTEALCQSRPPPPPVQPPPPPPPPLPSHPKKFSSAPVSLWTPILPQIYCLELTFAL